MAELELYGKRTSKIAKRLIIDLFNKINSEKPYIMKTITTIYNNDDIFTGNLRYPIDAPYRKFYKKLTEKYVIVHKLDNIFFEKGKAKTGEYFFEYAYERESNIFTIYNSPKEIKTEITKSYVPMLYSMVTGGEINWEDARSKVVFDKKGNNDSSKVLLVFGKDTLKTLDFSWLATFKLNISKKENAKKIGAEIRKQEPEIINYIQGVLFSSLEDVIIGFLQSQKQFHHTKSLIKDHKHTLKNFGFKGALNSLYHQIKNNREILNTYIYLENLELLRDYTTDILYNFGEKPSNLLLKKHGINTFTKILELIHSATTLHESKIISYKPEIEQHYLNLISDDDLPNIFTVLLNLYSNSRNHGKGEYKIELLISDNDCLKVVFKNKGLMPKSYLEYFMDNRADLKDVNGEGISIIKNALNKLNHISRTCETDDNSTTLILNITQKHESLQ